MKDILELIAGKTKPPIDATAINLTDELGELGIDSLSFLLLILDLETHTNNQGIFKPENISELRTVESIINKIEKF